MDGITCHDVLVTMPMCNPSEMQEGYDSMVFGCTIVYGAPGKKNLYLKI